MIQDLIRGSNKLYFKEKIIKKKLQFQKMIQVHVWVKVREEY